MKTAMHHDQPRICVINGADRFIYAGLILILTLSFPVLSFAQISRPAAYLSVSAPAGASVAVALPFDPFDSDISAAIEKDFGADGYILLWDASEQTYTPAANFHATAGDAFWIINENAFPITVFFSGVLIAESVSHTMIPQLNLIGLPGFNALSAGQIVNPGDLIQDARDAATVVDILEIGQGYWYSRNTTNSIAIELESPLVGWPNQPAAPTITDIKPGHTGSVVNLLISGMPGSSVALYAQDVAHNGALDHQAWEFIATGIITESGTLVIQDFRDDPSAIRLRVYVATAGGVDVKDAIEENISGEVGGSSIYCAPDQTTEASELHDDAMWNMRDSSSISDTITATTTNSAPVASARRARVIFVSSVIGDAAFTGEKSTRTGSDGPKKSIQQGLSSAQAGDSVTVMDGFYSESVRIRGEDHVRIKGNVYVRRPYSQPTDFVTSVSTNGGPSHIESRE